MNIFDYVKYYGDKDFECVPLNEVDALIFSCLTYLNFDNIIKIPESINDLSVNYFAKVTKENFKKQVNVGKLYTDCYNLLKLIKDKNRYKNLIISDYKKFVDDETQFGALAFRGDKFLFIAFEGTNNYISGWKEDFNLSSQFPVTSHLLAKEFIENNIKLSDRNIYVGGHSKGGNLSVVGSMLSKYNRKILNIYDFDGPGVRNDEFESHEYNLILNKIKKYVPKESMVGMIMNSAPIFKVIKSSSYVILQHDPFSWKCYGSFFVDDKLSNKSIKLKKDMEEFLGLYPKNAIEDFVKIVFDMFKEAKISKTRGISIGQIVKSTKYIKAMKTDLKTKEKLEKLIGIIINYINN